jgi:Dolichyl-phosphate-mannose-protein mannosyltransferase
MKTKYFISFLALNFVEGLLALLALLTMHFDSGRGHIFNYASLRLVLVGCVFFILAALVVLFIASLRAAKWTSCLPAWMEAQLAGPKKRLFFVQGALIIAAVFLFEFFLLTYLAFPIPLRPLFFWAGLACLEAWLLLRIAYAHVYQERASLAARLRSKWDGLLPVQRKIIQFLAVIGLVYFLAFIPSNLLRNEYGQFYLLQDEQVIYPDVVKAFAPQVDFAATVQNMLGSWNWAYGYPYLPISASVLIIPRLIFGEPFAEQIQLNVFLMRQFVSVLPMVLALMLAVYLVTRFKSVKFSVSLFAFLLLVPGVVKICYRFWHPDSIILFLVLLTIYFLQKDDLQFGRYFYLAAAACGLTTAIKLWGLFFFLAIAGYLIAGLIRHKISFKKFLLSGFLFILAMLGTFIITSPSMLVPYVARAAAASWTDQQSKILLGPERMDPSGIYQTGLMIWLKYFGQHFMKVYFFFFATIAVAAGALWGSRKSLNRILLAWCLPVTLFLAYFSAMKSFQYMLPVAIPLYCGAALLPELTGSPPHPKWLGLLEKPLTGKILRGITLAFFASQLIVSLVILYLFALRGR